MARMAALVALPVTLAELLEVRRPAGLSAHELRAVTAQTGRHLASLLPDAAGAISAVPLRHVTPESLQLTGSGQVRLGHSELCADAYSVSPEQLPAVLRSLGEVMLSAARGAATEPLTTLLTSLKDGHVTLDQLPQKLAETAADEPPGRPHHEVVALLHEELLGMDSLPLPSPQRSPSQLELTLNPALTESGVLDACRAGELLPADSRSVSHAGSFPEVSVCRARREQPEAGPGQGSRSPPEEPAEVEVSKISSSTELRNASCVVTGNYGLDATRTAGPLPAAAVAAGTRCHRQDVMLEKDMIRMMARQSSAENLATSTPNQSLVAPPDGATVAPPGGALRRRRPVGRRPSALYGPRPGRPAPGERAFCGPEFVIRAREKPRRVDLPQRHGSSSCVLVILLNGQKLELGCQPDVHTVADVTKVVFEEDPYPHPSLLGLAVLSDGEFLFPPPATRLNKALVSHSNSRITLYQRFKLYPSVELLPRASTGLHLLYLQLRHNLLENTLDVSSNQVVQLSSLALLAEFGDRSGQTEPDECDAAYFLPEHYLPEPLTSQTELLRQLTEGHVTCGEAAAGPAAAERRFVRVAAGCRGYGRHRCSVDMRVKSYSTSTLSIDPSCLRLTRCDPSGRSTTRTLHWSTVSKIEYKRSRRLVVSTAGAEALTFCGDKAKLRCLEYMMQQHLTSFRDGLHLTSGSAAQMYRAKADPTSPQLTNYCVRTPLSTLTANRAPPRRPAPPTAAVPANQVSSCGPAPPTAAGSTNPASQCGLAPPTATNQTADDSPVSAKQRRRSAGGPLRARGLARTSARWQSASQLVARRESSPPPAGIRMGTRIPVSALQRQKLRSREALPHLTDAAYVIAAEIPPTPESALPPGVRPIGSTAEGSSFESRPPGPYDVTLHRCPRTGGLGVRVVQGSPSEGGVLHVESVTPGGPADRQGHVVPGDVITHIAGASLSCVTYSAAVDRLRRAVDPVALSLSRRPADGAAKRPADAADEGDDVSGGSLEKRRRCGSGEPAPPPAAGSVNDLVMERLNRQLSGDRLATPTAAR